jgi:hypothetical protein
VSGATQVGEGCSIFTRDYRTFGALSVFTPHLQVTLVAIMDFITIFLIAMVIGAMALAPRFGAESRPAFIRPDHRPHGAWSPARPWDWD